MSWFGDLLDFNVFAGKDNLSGLGNAFGGAGGTATTGGQGPLRSLGNDPSAATSLGDGSGLVDSFLNDTVSQGGLDVAFDGSKLSEVGQGIGVGGNVGQGALSSYQTSGAESGLGMSDLMDLFDQTQQMGGQEKPRAPLQHKPANLQSNFRPVTGDPFQGKAARSQLPTRGLF